MGAKVNANRVSWTKDYINGYGDGCACHESFTLIAYDWWKFSASPHKKDLFFWIFETWAKQINSKLDKSMPYQISNLFSKNIDSRIDRSVTGFCVQWAYNLGLLTGCIIYFF